MKYIKGLILLVLAAGLGYSVFILLNNTSSVTNKVENIANLPVAPLDETQATTDTTTVKAVDASSIDWTFEKYKTIMLESDRKPGIDANTFLEIQKRKQEASQIVDTYLTERLGSADPAVLRAFNEVPREYFQYHYQNDNSFASVAYETPAKKVKPWAIGWGSALSDYLGQTYMTQITKPTANDVALEIGTGSGYQSALLSRIVKKMYSIEIIKPLGEAVSNIYKPLGYNNVETRVGDGFYGWPEVEGGFDIIIVTAAAQYVPPALIEQLKPNGRMVIPVGQPFKKGQVLYVYTKDADGRVHSRKDVGVYFIPFTGAIQNTKAN
ncbi:MAG: protein-L-isoaspartate O-methyltransferase [Candidatus Paceibacterota bacterium]